MRSRGPSFHLQTIALFIGSIFQDIFLYFTCPVLYLFLVKVKNKYFSYRQKAAVLDLGYQVGVSVVASAFVRHSNSVASVVGGRPSSVARGLSQALKVHSDSLATGMKWMEKTLWTEVFLPSLSLLNWHLISLLTLTLLMLFRSIIMAKSWFIFWYFSSVRGVSTNCCSWSASGLSLPLCSFLFNAWKI